MGGSGTRLLFCFYRSGVLWSFIVMAEVSVKSVVVSLFEGGGFEFPIATQAEARKGVKALKTRGVLYREIAVQINEYSSNLSAWLRERQARYATGNRVIEWLNRPYQNRILRQYGGVVEEDLDQTIFDDSSSSDDQEKEEEEEEKEEESGGVPHPGFEEYISDDEECEGLAVTYTATRRATNDNGYVYLMRDLPTRVKVGASRHPMNRLAQFKTANLDIVLLTAFHVRQQLDAERAAHEALSHLHIRGEWYNWTDGIIQDVENAINEYLL